MINSMSAPVDVLAVLDQLSSADMNPHGYIRAQQVRAAVAALIASQEKSREVLRNIVRDGKGGIHYAAAQAACHQANDALARVQGGAA